MSNEELNARRSLMEMDPPEHTTYRRIVQPPFSHAESAGIVRAIPPAPMQATISYGPSSVPESSPAK